MPQLTLTLSHNIKANLLDFRTFFEQVHEALKSVPNMNVNTAHSGVIQESFSYIGLEHPRATKVYLQLYWVESEDRALIKPELGKILLKILKETLVPEVQNQGLICIPRVRIANLGKLNESYFIYEE